MIPQMSMNFHGESSVEQIWDLKKLNVIAFCYLTYVSAGTNFSKFAVGGAV